MGREVATDFAGCAFDGRTTDPHPDAPPPAPAPACTLPPSPAAFGAVPCHSERTSFMTKAFRTRLLSGLFVALVAFAPGGPARASEEKSEPHPYVVLVGISQYHDKQIKPRPHAEADAKALY